MKVKTSELTGAALDWAVAKCEGYFDIGMASVHDGVVNVFYFPAWQPSTDWAQGGPIIAREGVAIDCIRWDGKVDGWIAALPLFCEAKYEEPSPTPLVAAMRCFVASKLGDEVDVPDELVKGETK